VDEDKGHIYATTNGVPSIKNYNFVDEAKVKSIISMGHKKPKKRK
jgi:hypothetical protein